MAAKLSRSNLRLSGVSTKRQFIAAVVAGVLVTLVFVLYNHFRNSNGVWNVLNAQTLSAFTTPFGLTFSLLSIFKDFGNRPRKVKLLMPSTSDYQSAIVNGFELTLGKLSRDQIELENLTPKSHHRDENLQLDILRSLRSEKLDGLVIMPSKMNNSVIEELRQLYLRGVFIVLLEYELPAEIFNSPNFRSPYVITPDFKYCGTILGQECMELIQRNHDSSVINVIGPIGEMESAQGADIRSASQEIFKVNGLNDRVTEISLKSWNAADATDAIFKAIKKVSNACSGKIIISCGTDRILIQLWTLLYNEKFNPLRDRIMLIGFDGIRDFRGELMIGLSMNAIGTIDTKPTEIGMQAAQVILDEYAGNLAALAAPHLIEPEFARV